MQQVAVEEDDVPAFTSTGISVSTRRTRSLSGEVELVGLGAAAAGRGSRLRCEPGIDPQAAVLDGGVVERDPRADKRAVAGGDVDLVLVPRLALDARRFDEEHRLHALHAAVPAGQVGGGDALDTSAIAAVSIMDRTTGLTQCGKWTASNRGSSPRVPPSRSFGTGGALIVGKPAWCESDRLGVDLGDLLRRHEVGYDEVAVGQITVDDVISQLLVVRRHAAILASASAGRKLSTCPGGRVTARRRD